MIDNHIPVQFSDRRRRFIDRMTRRFVTACGIGVLGVMLLLFLWLIWVVLPLFSAPSIHAGITQQLWQNQPALALGAEGRWGWRIDNQGIGQFIPLNGEPAEPALRLADKVIAAASTADNQAVMLLTPAGGIRVIEPDFSDPGGPRWKFPLGDGALSLGEGGLQHPALAHLADGRWLAAAANATQITLGWLAPHQPIQRQRIDNPATRQLLVAPNGKLLFALSGNLLRVWRLDTEKPTLRDAITLHQPVERMTLLSGGHSLLLSGPTGVSQWFDIASETGPHLNHIRRFSGTGTGLVVSEPQRRVFAVISPQGALSLFASKQDQAIFHHHLPPGITQARFTPAGDGLLTERDGLWQYWQLDNPWPDVSWRSVWQKVWYENYPQPDWTWQATSAEDHYQAKFSLVPMVVGTLKAALLAMLFAMPLALAAAIYTAWFMSPGLRRWIKPAIEMMGALPSVVVGLIAGLWLAPRVANHLAGVLALPFMLALTLLLCGWGARRLPARWRQWFFAAGREPLLLIPLLLLMSLLCLWLFPLLDSAIFGRGMAERLSEDYAQRNLLVAGVAMGFALVPLIFTLAEDAIFSVPASLGQGSLALGATPWQTLSRVVLPGASPGIFAALMIGFGRAMGETMIVLMATGNTPRTEGGLFQGLRTLSANIAVEMPEAAAGSAHYRILFLSALVLLLFTLVVNTLAEVVRQRLRQRYSQHEGQG
ncbi:ABC transporter permease subunit [Paramixta manurensis]|uniref:ABC transporter permease subunit n=1 Tax=Paramixta manurensis TaxID=2740817 RepID=A0A6M8UMP8_9GAMM|nr:ABC transporter permease subunit [Erwiniaceae bacterium PD-1]